jgi:hypothetical protein
MMLLAYWQKARSKWFVLVFAIASAATAAYSGPAEAYRNLGVEAVRSLVALLRFRARFQADSAPDSAWAGNVAAVLALKVHEHHIVLLGLVAHHPRRSWAICGLAFSTSSPSRGSGSMSSSWPISIS